MSKQELLEQYEQLGSEYSLLETEHSQLESEYSRLELNQAKLEKNHADLEKNHADLEHTHADLESAHLQLKFEIAQLKKLIFASKSEKLKSTEIPAEQLNLFTNPEDGKIEEASKEVEQISYERKKNKVHKGRNALPSHLPTKEVIIEPEVDTSDMIRIGETVTETLDYTPASLIKVITIRPKYIAKDQSEDDETTTIHIGSLPDRPLKRSIAESGLLSSIVTSKFIDHLPFYRQIQRFKREYNWEPSKSTVNDWFIAICTLMEPLYEKLQAEMLKSTYIHGDESPIKVQDKSKKGKTHLGYQWVYMSPSAKLILFQYHRSRSMQAPKELLGGYKGYLQCDGYKVYDKLEKLYQNIRLVGCWVHARRKFNDALSTDTKLSTHALVIIKQIYKHETVCKGLTPQKRKEYRNIHTKPLMDSLKEWISEESIKVLPQSPIGKAMTYTQNQWDKLIRVLEDGKLELDNNNVENKIRPLALGRKNYLFAGSHPAAQRIAMMYSFFASCKINDINPYNWLKHVLDNINDTKMQNLHQLLPNNINL